jgi:phosphate transport system substrate-binding protein
MLLDGQLSVAQSSRSLKPEELAEAKSRGFTLEQIPVAIDGIALYVSRQLSIPGLTLAQIKDIYTGKITNWNQVGGPNLAITPLSRNPQDGGTPESIRKAANTPGGIGYATASEVCNQEMVKPIPIARGANQGFVSPCEGKLVNKPVFANDTYPITRRLFAIVKRDGKLDEQAGVAYANLLLSEEGQQIVDRAGLVPIRTP